MNRILASTSFWALPEASAEIILRELFMSIRRNNADALVTDSSHVHSSDARASQSKPAQAGVLFDGNGTPAPDGLAVVRIEGPLVNGGSWLWFTGYDDIRGEIEAALADNSVKAILLDIDSPGGSVAGCQELAGFIADAAKQKPMAAFTNSLMASAAYWLGSATGRVYCTETADVGSIGVIMTLYDHSSMLEQYGVKVNVITSGSFKAAGHPALELSDEHRAYFQSRVSTIHSVFRRSVAEGMGLDMAKAEEWGDAQVFLGEAARNVGLATAVVRGREEAVNMLFQEVIMDRATLAAQHPELLAEILAEGKAQAMAEHTFSAEAFMACMKPFMEADAYARAEDFMKSCAAAGLTPEQTVKMAAVVRVPETHTTEAGKANKGKTDAMASILAGIQAAQNTKVGTKLPEELTPAQSLAQAAEKRSAK